MTTLNTRAIRRVGAVMILPLAALAASCTAPPRACPTLTEGHWSGSWASSVVSGIGGSAQADLTVSHRQVTGTVELSNSAFVGQMPISGSIRCNKVKVSTPTGITITGKVAPSGSSLSGSYVSSSPSDSGTFDISADAS